MQAGLSGPALGTSPHEVAFREVTFAESVHKYAEEDAASSSSEKVAVIQHCSFGSVTENWQE